MKNNPFANVFRTAFIKDVLNDCIYISENNTNLKDTPRIGHFLDALNKFLYKSGLRPIFYQKYIINEQKLLEYALFLRGYMRDAQPILATLKPEYSTDSDLIDLFKASSEYVVACNNQFGNKKFFDNNVDYRLWKLHTNNVISNAEYTKASDDISPFRHNLFLFMPFRIKDDQTEIQKWVLKNMRTTLDNPQIFGSQVDVYVNHYPIQKSRASNIYSLLETLRNPETYYEQQDMNFVIKNLLPFIKKDTSDIKNKKDLYQEEELYKNFNNITIFGYCSGAANAHRVLNALYTITAQLYGKETALNAMQRIGIITYGFLPIQKHSLYSGIHFYTNAIDDVNRREPFVNLNNHTLYEQTKCSSTEFPAKYSVMPDGRNFIVALKMPEQMEIITEGSQILFKDSEFGHSMNFINQTNLLDDKNYAYNMFIETLQKFSLGKRHLDDITLLETPKTDNPMIHALLKKQIKSL